MKYEYKYIQQITKHRRDEHGNIIEAVFDCATAEKVLNDAGKDGWQAVCLIPDMDGNTLMKREVPEIPIAPQDRNSGGFWNRRK